MKPTGRSTGYVCVHIMIHTANFSFIINKSAVTYWRWCAQFAENSLFVFTLHNPLRRLALRLMLSPWFERLILALIVVNTVFLGLQDFSHIVSGDRLSISSPQICLLIRSPLLSPCHRRLTRCRRRWVCR